MRNHHLITQLCAELGEYWWRIAQYNAASSGGDWKRTERRHQEDAAIDLITAVRSLPAPLRTVIELRSAGLSWRDVYAAMPGRPTFSIQDDYTLALRTLTQKHDDLVWRVL